MYIRDYNKTTVLYDNDAFIVDGSQETQYILAKDLYQTLIGNKGFVTEQWITQKGFMNREQVDNLITSKGYQTVEQVNTIITSKGYQTVEQVRAIVESYGYINANDVNLIIDSKNFLEASDLNGYATESWVTDKGYQTEAQVNTLITAKGYQTADNVNTIIDRKGYATESWVTDKGYQNENQVKALIGESSSVPDNVLTTNNYMSKITTISNQLTLNNGSYISHQEGTTGTTGYVNFMQIKIVSQYANRSFAFLLSGRGRNIPMLLTIHFQSINTYDPALSSFYRLFNDTYEVYLYHTGTGQWDLYAPKNEAYGSVDILDLWYYSGSFNVSYPNTHVASASSSWIKATTAGIVENANTLKDSGNGTPIYLSYNKPALAPANTPWLAGWVNNNSNFELRAIARTAFLHAKRANGYCGMATDNYEDNQWIRTTTLGIIPYQQGAVGSGHCSLGTSTWSFLKSYIDTMVTHKIMFNDSIAIIQAFDDGDGADYGCELVVTGMGNTFVGGGESAQALRMALQAAVGTGEVYGKASERLYLTSDGEIFFYSNANTIGDRKGLMLGSGIFKPIKNKDCILGDITHMFEKIYSEYIVNVRYIKFGGSPWVAISAVGPNLYFYANGSSINDTNYVAGLVIQCPPDTTSSYPVIHPKTNGYGRIGTSSFKWNQVWATNGAIQTSDKNEKKEISYIGIPTAYDTSMSDEILVKFVRGLGVVVYKRKNGESGRPHHGFIAQDVEALMEKLGIKDHAAFIKSPIIETKEWDEEVENEDGKIETVHKMEEIDTGKFSYGLRYEEFIPDNTRAIQILFDMIDERDKIIKNLTERIAGLEAMVLC